MLRTHSISLPAMQADNWDRAEQHEIREENAGGKWDDDYSEHDDADRAATADASVDDAASVSHSL